jgi:hypothetical protein
VADRMLNQFQGTFEKGVVTAFAEVSFGASGAPTLVTGRYKGVASISRTSAGLYVITLSDKYQRLLVCNHRQKVASGMPAAPVLFVVTDAVSSTKALTVQFAKATDASTTTLVAGDPASGEKALFEFVLSNSTAL